MTETLPPAVEAAIQARFSSHQWRRRAREIATLAAEQARQAEREAQWRDVPGSLPYERLALSSEALCKAVRLNEGEHLLVLQPFGWHLDGKHIPNAAEHFSREGVCREHRWEVVCEFGPYIAVVRALPPAPDGSQEGQS